MIAPGVNVERVEKEAKVAGDRTGTGKFTENLLLPVPELQKEPEKHQG